MKKGIFNLLCCTLLIGCVPTYHIEELGVISALGIDLVDDGKLETTFNYFKFDPEKTSQSTITSTTARTLKGTQDRGNLESNLKLVGGQLRLIIFGKEMAEDGLIRVIDNFSRDAKLSDTMYFSTTDATAKEIITAADKNKDLDAENYLFELIDNNIKREIIMRSSFRDFMHEFNMPGIDPVLPLIELEKDKPIIKDVALFQDDKYVEKATQQEGFFIKLLTSRFKSGQLELAIPKEPFQDYINKHAKTDDQEQITVTLSEVRSNNKIKLVSAQELSFKVDIDIETRLLEVSEKVAISNEAIAKRFEKEIEKKINSKLNNLTSKLKELQVDPIGFGQVYNSTVRGKNLSDGEWRDKIPDIQVDFNVTVAILRHGLTQ
ncbi:Ger(x)C family spore germination protein [Aquibacillus kalidii]|uniref:Ger(x)C family spore germination protein n=1 Tax=Aquibacillus kalidii TaxID=2762597 RepID=UPI0016445FC9|nr:Ger(x)C family spore germination protein [Aquibacillus kalidii]